MDSSNFFPGASIRDTRILLQSMKEAKENKAVLIILILLSWEKEH